MQHVVHNAQHVDGRAVHATAAATAAAATPALSTPTAHPLGAEQCRDVTACTLATAAAATTTAATATATPPPSLPPPLPPPSPRALPLMPPAFGSAGAGAPAGTPRQAAATGLDAATARANVASSVSSLRRSGRPGRRRGMMEAQLGKLVAAGSAVVKTTLLAAIDAGLETDDKRRVAMEPVVKATAMMLDAIIGLTDDVGTVGSAMDSVRDCADGVEERSWRVCACLRARMRACVCACTRECECVRATTGTVGARGASSAAGRVQAWRSHA